VRPCQKGKSKHVRLICNHCCCFATMRRSGAEAA
jgi:hypothetical protein